MSRHLFLAVFILLGIARVKAFAQDTLVGDDENYLEMRGKVFESKGQERDEDKVGLDSAEVKVTNESGKEVLFGLTDEKGRLDFRLPLGRKFTINISKKGYVKKMILVDTHVPADQYKVYVFTFNADIFEKIDGLDVSVLNQPVARVAFKPFDKTFSYDAAYTNKVNAGLQKMYREYYTLKRREEQAADSAAKKPVTVKSGGSKRSVPYGQGSRPH